MTKDINYIKEIIAFNNSLLTNELSAGQIALWYALVYINNSCQWEERFTVSNKTLENQTGLSKSGIAKAREALKEKGYIDFEDNGTKATIYHINYIYSAMEESSRDSSRDSSRESSQESSQDSGRESSQDSVRDSSQDSVQDSGRICTPLNKLNNNKLNYVLHTPTCAPARTPTKNRFNNFRQRDTDIDALETQLISNIV